MASRLASNVKGLSEVDFRERYGGGEPCRSAIAEMRWRDGFRCPSCGHQGHAFLKKRGHWQCNRCKHQVSVTAGTIFHSTKLPLTVWFFGDLPSLAEQGWDQFSRAWSPPWRATGDRVEPEAKADASDAAV